MGGRTAQYLDTLAAALAAQGRYEDALNTQIEALQLLGESRDAGAFAARLILYRTGRPFVFASPAK